MYFNNVHILFFVLIAFVGLIVGKFISYANEKMVTEKRIFTKDFFKEVIKNYDFNYIIMIAISGIYVFLVYKFGFKNGFFKNLDLIKFLILTPMLVSAFFIDLKYRIIPNRLNLTIFEIGILFTVIYGCNNINVAKDMLLGGIAGAGIFGIITVLGGLIAGKEAMGLGDVKFMGAVGFYFGMANICQISLLAFVIAAIMSIFILFIRIVILKKKDDEYIPFGPFLVVACVTCMFLPNNSIWKYFMMFCDLLSGAIMNLFI